LLQELAGEAEFFDNEAKWLQTTCSEFGSTFRDSNDARLRNVCRQFEMVKPALNANSSTTGDVSCLAFEFRDSATKQMNWFEAVRSSMPEIARNSSSVDSLRSMLIKYEVFSFLNLTGMSYRPLDVFLFLLSNGEIFREKHLACRN
jgi:hypothetical protein